MVRNPQAPDFAGEVLAFQEIVLSFSYDKEVISNSL